MNEYNVYDFDGTIYDGDSSVDLFLYILKKYPISLFILPRFIFYAVKYRLGICSKEILKAVFFSFLKFVPDIDRELINFWQINERKIYKWYKEKDHKSDVIISASPEFLIRPVMEKYNVYTVIGTNVCKKTGDFLGKNCHGVEKVKRFKKELGDTAKVVTFYSDSKSDFPMAEISQKAYLIKNGKKISWIAEKNR